MVRIYFPAPCDYRPYIHCKPNWRSGIFIASKFKVGLHGRGWGVTFPDTRWKELSQKPVIEVIATAVFAHITLVTDRCMANRSLNIFCRNRSTSCITIICNEIASKKRSTFSRYPLYWYMPSMCIDTGPSRLQTSQPSIATEQGTQFGSSDDVTGSMLPPDSRGVPGTGIVTKHKYQE